MIFGDLRDRVAVDWNADVHAIAAFDWGKDKLRVVTRADGKEFPVVWEGKGLSDTQTSMESTLGLVGLVLLEMRFAMRAAAFQQAVARRSLSREIPSQLHCPAAK